MKHLFKEILTEGFALLDLLRQTVKTLVYQSLQLAAQNGLTSIAFPPLGVGRRFDFDQITVAEAMSRAFQKYAQKNSNTMKVNNFQKFIKSRLLLPPLPVGEATIMVLITLLPLYVICVSMPQACKYRIKMLCLHGVFECCVSKLYRIQFFCLFA